MCTSPCLSIELENNLPQAWPWLPPPPPQWPRPSPRQRRPGRPPSPPSPSLLLLNPNSAPVAMFTLHVTRGDDREIRNLKLEAPRPCWLLSGWRPSCLSLSAQQTNFTFASVGGRALRMRARQGWWNLKSKYFHCSLAARTQCLHYYKCRTSYRV